MRLSSCLAVIFGLTALTSSKSCYAANGCIYKVVSPSGGVLYLAGSWHALRSVDYPLPAAYNRAFDAASRLAFEVSPKDRQELSKALPHAGQYGRGDSLKSHVDPRTYDYLRRYFAAHKIPEERFSRFRAWFLAMSLRSGTGEFFSRLGLESFFERRARANSKPVAGLESLKEHLEVFSGLSDRSAEAVLLISLMPVDKSSPDFDRMMAAWREGNAGFLSNAMHSHFRDFPAMADRLLGARNRNWIPKIEQFAGSGRTYFVVVGAAHLGGPDGVVALLKSRGYQVQPL